MRYFPAQKTNALRKEIIKFKQLDSESLYECWEWYKKLFLEFPHHGFPNWQRVQYFYEGLRPENRQMVDITVGGSLATKTPEEALEVFEMISESSQNWDLTLMRSHQSDVSAENSSKIASLENAIGEILQMMQLQNDKIQDLQTGFQTIGASMSIIQNMQDLMSRMEAQMSQPTVADQTTRVPEILPIQPEIDYRPHEQVMAITVQQSEEKVKRSPKKKKVKEPEQEYWDPRFEPLPFPQAPGWGEIARSRGRPVPDSFMENRTIDKEEAIEGAKEWKRVLSRWEDNEQLPHIVDDSDSDTEEQPTGSVEHADPVDSANLEEHTDISFMMDEPVTTTPEEQNESMVTEQSEFQIIDMVSHSEEKEHYCYMMDAYEDPYLYSFEAEQPMDVRVISFCSEDPEITTSEERIKVEIEDIPTTNLTKQVVFRIFEVASYHEEKECDCYIVDVIPDLTLFIEPRHDVFYMTDTKAYQKARC